MPHADKIKPMFKDWQKLIICRGIPGCGKTTFAREQQKKDPSLKRINRDDLRAMLDNSVWSKANEGHIVAIRDILIARFVHAGCNIIIDDTNISPKRVKEIAEVARSFNPNITIEVKTFDTPLDVCLERNAKRTGIARVPDDIVRKFYNDLKNSPPVDLSELD